MEFDFYIAFYFHFLYIRTYPNTFNPAQKGSFKGGRMTKVIMGLLIIVVLILCFLLFWIAILSAALLFFGRGGKEEKDLLSEKPGTA